MAIVLKKGTIRLVAEKAGEKYRGCRFDRNGTVVSARWRGVELLSDEMPRFRRNRRRFGRGLHNEFGIKRAVGFDDCAVGEWFPKIGVGWLRKDGEPYRFFADYELEPADFRVESESGSLARFVCVSGNRNGYGYEYVKEIEVLDDGFAVRYSLENTGEKKLSTDEYAHNFALIGGARIGSRYKLTVPWTIDRALLDEFVDPEGIIALSGGEIGFSGPVRQTYFVGGLSNGVGERDGLAACWTLTDATRGVSFGETGSFMPSLMNLWGHGGVISPELFFSFSVEPGNIVSWERRYRAFSPS